MDRLTTRVIGIALAAAVVSAAFIGGFVLGHARTGIVPSIAPSARSDAERAVSEVRRILRRQALKPSTEESMTVGVVEGILESLDDDYAMYFDPRHFEYFQEQNQGEFYGIGITIAGKDGTAYIVSVIEDTPAERAGLKAEDRIVGIDGDEREKWDIDDVVKRIRGPEGTEVTVSVRRGDEEELRDFRIERAKIDYPNLMKRKVGDDVGYIRLLSFNGKAAEDISKAMRDLRKDGAKGFVLDLRNNPGGMLDESVDVASLFIEDGVIVRVEKRNGPEETHRARRGKATDAPLVVLVNENSASASEIVAGALQDYGRAPLVGAKTFGKGSVQTVEELSTGGAVKFTIAHYLTPKSRVIDGKGLTPDVAVDMKHEDAADEETDVQLKRAVEELRKLL
ncbi:MAG: S41 family peptidase [Coriobacteriia bacterium]|nr:S41 family peptidase [Coriobacteriia bacterium]